jgi:hypothetical protein
MTLIIKQMKPYFKIMVVAVLLVLHPNMIFGQLSISGHIIEIKTRKPVQFANFWIKDANIGTTSDKDGFFTIVADSLSKNKNVVISAIGYSDTIIALSNIKNEICLRQKTYQLPEIAVTLKKRNVLIINDLSGTKLNAIIMNDTTPQIVGRFFHYDERNLKFRYVKSVTIYSIDIHKGKFNLRLYSFDTVNLKPVRELVNQNIIVETRLSLIPQPKPVEIDLSKYKIVFPDEGLLICVEWLIIPENRYKVTTSYTDSKTKKVEIKYSPELSATLDKDGYVYQYIRGFWSRPIHRNMQGDLVYFNPAISLKLTD